MEKEVETMLYKLIAYKLIPTIKEMLKGQQKIEKHIARIDYDINQIKSKSN